MAIAFSCSCGRKINAKDEHAGKRVKCPQCQQALTVPGAGGAAAKPQAVAAGAARKPAAAAPKKPAPAPVDDDMYDVKEDAPPAKRGGGGASAPASPWGDDDPGLDAPIAAPRPYASTAGPVAGGAAPRGTGAAGASAAPAGAMGSYAQLGSKRGAVAAAKGASGLHLGPMAKFLIGAAIILPTTFFIFKQGPVKAMKEWGVAEPAGEDDARSVVNRVIHDMDAATMPPPDPDRDNRDGIPYHPEVTHFFYPDPPTVMWRMPDKVWFEGSTTFGPYEGWYYTRERRVECDMDWKGGDKLKVVGQCNETGGVKQVLVDGIKSDDKAAISKKFGGFGSWNDDGDAKKTIGKAGANAAKGGRAGRASDADDE